MPINALLQHDGSFGPEDIAVLVTAFEEKLQAWRPSSGRAVELAERGAARPAL
jgi:hypothetical protein